MKKLSPKFVTFRNAPVTYVNAETNVEETRIVPQIVFSLEKEIDLGDNTERKTLFFFMSQWRKAFHEIGAGAYLQEMDKRFGDDIPKHQDAFNRLSQACTWSVDLNDDGFPVIVGVELPDAVKAAAAKFKAARDAEMAAFGVQSVLPHPTSSTLISLALAGPCASFCFLTKDENNPQTQAKQILPQTDAEQIPVVNTSVERAIREIVCNFIATNYNAT